MKRMSKQEREERIFNAQTHIMMAAMHLKEAAEWVSFNKSFMNRAGDIRFNAFLLHDKLEGVKRK